MKGVLNSKPKRVAMVAVATPCWPAPVSAITRVFLLAFYDFYRRDAVLYVKSRLLVCGLHIRIRIGMDDYRQYRHQDPAYTISAALEDRYGLAWRNDSYYIHHSPASVSGYRCSKARNHRNTRSRFWKKWPQSSEISPRSRGAFIYCLQWYSWAAVYKAAQNNDTDDAVKEEK